jgi:hypothetical protein
MDTQKWGWVGEAVLQDPQLRAELEAGRYLEYEELHRVYRDARVAEAWQSPVSDRIN